MAAARASLLGAIPRGGFVPEAPLEAPLAQEPTEELLLTPDDASLEEGEPVLATDLAPVEDPEEMPEGRVPIRELSPRDLALLDALDRLAAGLEDPSGTLKPARLLAALLRLLVHKRIVSEQELLDELSPRG